MIDFARHRSSVRSVAFSPDGKQVVSGGTDRALRVWDFPTGEVCRVFKGHTDCVNSVAYSPNGEFIVSAGDDLSLRIWDALTGKRLFVLYDQYRIGAHSVAISPDGKFIALGGLDSTVKVWDAVTSQLVRIFDGCEYMAYSMTFSLDSKRIITSGCNALRFLDIATGQESQSALAHELGLFFAFFSPDYRYAVLVDCHGQMALFDVATHCLLHSFTGYNTQCCCAVFSPDGKRIVYGNLDGLLRVCDVVTGQEISTFSGHSLGVTAVACSPDGRSIISSCVDGLIRHWELPRTERKYDPFARQLAAEAFVDPSACRALADYLEEQQLDLPGQLILLHQENLYPAGYWLAEP